MSTTLNRPAHSTKSVLLADDEEVTRSLVREGLELIDPRWRVTEIDSLNSLRFCLTDRYLDLVICNLAIDSITAEAMMIEISHDHPRLPAILITDEPSVQMRDLSRRLAHWVTLTRPVEFEHLVAVVKDAFDARAHSRVEGFSLVSFLQLMELDRKTATLKVTSGDLRGTICFQSGVPTYAGTTFLVGEPAIYEMLSWSNPAIRVFDHLETNEENLVRSLKGLLLDGCQRIDEMSERGIA
jgi:CheY-like chemotaxis protein